MVLFFVLRQQKAKVTAVWLTEEVNCCDRAGGAKKEERQSRLGRSRRCGMVVVGEGGSKKLEERRQELVLPGPGASFCSQRPDFNHSRTMEGIVNPDWQNCYVVVAQLTMQEACY